MTQYNLGRVTPIFQGDYDPKKSYECLDVVLFNGSSYVAKTDTLGNEPSMDSKFWQMVASAGTGGGGTCTVDSELSTESINPVQNKVITLKINQLESLIIPKSTIQEIIENYQYQTAEQVEQAIVSKNYQTAEQVEQAITGKGYQNADQVEQAITGKGYQNAEQVETAITSKKYQTSEQVENAITSKDFQTSRQVDTAITSKGYQNAQDVENAIIEKDYASNTKVTKVATDRNIKAVDKTAIQDPQIPVSTGVSEERVQEIIDQNTNNFQNAEQVESTIISKQYQTSSQVESAITSKGYQTSSDIDARGYTTLTEVNQQGFAKSSEIPTDNASLANGAGYVKKVEIATINNQSITEGGNIDISGSDPKPYQVKEWDIETQGNTVIIETNSITIVKQVMNSGGIFTGGVPSMNRAKFYFNVAAGTILEFDDGSQVYGDFREKFTYGGTYGRSNIRFEKAHTILGEFYNGGNSKDEAGIYILFDVTGQEGRLTLEDIPSGGGGVTPDQVQEIINQNTAGFAKTSELPEPITVDDNLSDSSTNPLQNKVVTAKLNTLKDEVDTKTTIAEVEAKGYQTDAQVKSTLTANPDGYAKTTDVDTKLSKKADSTRVDEVSASIPTNTEEWSFTLDDGSVVKKSVYIDII